MDKQTTLAIWIVAVVFFVLVVVVLVHSCS
jgi:hypothetical protein